MHVSVKVYTILMTMKLCKDKPLLLVAVFYLFLLIMK